VFEIRTKVGFRFRARWKQWPSFGRVGVNFYWTCIFLECINCLSIRMCLYFVRCQIHLPEWIQRCSEIKKQNRQRFVYVLKYLTEWYSSVWIKLLFCLIGNNRIDSVAFSERNWLLTCPLSLWIERPAARYRTQQKICSVYSRGHPIWIGRPI
jgi:hypothetical protein